MAPVKIWIKRVFGIGQAQSLTWTRDPFDRLIVAKAMAANAKLITHDENIRLNFLRKRCGNDGLLNIHIPSGSRLSALSASMASAFWPSR